MTYGLILRHLLMLIVTLGLGIFWLYVKEVEAVYAHVDTQTRWSRDVG